MLLNARWRRDPDVAQYWQGLLLIWIALNNFKTNELIARFDADEALDGLDGVVGCLSTGDNES